MVEGLVSEGSGGARDRALRMAGEVLPQAIAAIAAGPLAEALDRAMNANAAQNCADPAEVKVPTFAVRAQSEPSRTRILSPPVGPGLGIEPPDHCLHHERHSASAETSRSTRGGPDLSRHHAQIQVTRRRLHAMNASTTLYACRLINPPLALLRRSETSTRRSKNSCVDARPGMATRWKPSCARFVARIWPQSAQLGYTLPRRSADASRLSAASTSNRIRLSGLEILLASADDRPRHQRHLRDDAVRAKPDRVCLGCGTASLYSLHDQHHAA